MMVSSLLKSRILLLTLLLGNATLAFTTVVQGHIIQNQKQLIRQLFQDSAELTSFRMAANQAKQKK
jgi:hypothetical protein